MLRDNELILHKFHIIYSNIHIYDILEEKTLVTVIIKIRSYADELRYIRISNDITKMSYDPYSILLVLPAV